MSDQGMTAADHAALMDRTYRYQRLFYDATRAWFLFGRNHLIRHLAPPPGGSVLELACGTGRNLDLIGRRYPGRSLYGLDISEEMLRSARAKLGPRATLVQGDACAVPAEALFGKAGFDRVALSYSLSMIPDWRRALEQAVALVAPGGELHVVDFGDLRGYPGPFRKGMDLWLGKFHVTPRLDLAEALRRVAWGYGARVEVQKLYRGYATHGVIRRP